MAAAKMARPNCLFNCYCLFGQNAAAKPTASKMSMRGSSLIQNDINQTAETSKSINGGSCETVPFLPQVGQFAGKSPNPLCL